MTEGVDEGLGCGTVVLGSAGVGVGAVVGVSVGVGVGAVVGVRVGVLVGVVRGKGGRSAHPVSIVARTSAATSLLTSRCAASGPQAPRASTPPG